MEADSESPGKIRKKNSVPHRKSLSCEYCHRSFARLEHLQRHLRTRESPQQPIPSVHSHPSSPCELLTCFNRYQGEAVFMRDMLQIFCKKVCCTNSAVKHGADQPGGKFCSDLLVRHERLVHPAEAAAHRGERRVGSDSHDIPPTPSSLIQPPHHDSRMLDIHDSVPVQPPPVPPAEVPVHQTPMVEANQFNPSWGYDLNLLSHAASHVALEGQQEATLDSVRKPPTHPGPPPTCLIR